MNHLPTNLSASRKPAVFLGLTARTIRHMIHRGELPPIIKIGKPSRLLYSDILKYIQSPIQE